MYGSITQLELKSEQDLQDALEGLEAVLAHVRGLTGFRDCYVLRTSALQLTMVTIYESEAASRTATERLRPMLAETVGPHVAGPPERSAGDVAVGPPEYRVSRSRQHGAPGR
jgi:hypothetical protein